MAAGVNFYLSYNPEKNPVDDKNEFYPASFGVLALCGLLSKTAEGIRVVNLMRNHRKMPSPCLLLFTSTVVAAGVAYWMRDETFELVSRCELNQTNHCPQRAFNLLATDPMPDWYIATGSNFLIAVGYHSALRIIIFCKRKHAEEPPVYLLN